MDPKLVFVTVMTTLEETEFASEGEFTVDAVAEANSDVLLVADAHDDAVADIIAVRDLSALNDEEGLRDSTGDADEDGVKLRVASAV